MSIPKAEAEEFIGRYIAIHDELVSSGVLSNITNPVVKDYYSSGLISFIFTKDRIDALFQGTTANALRIYYGAHSDGHPTMVIVASNVSTENKTADNKVDPVGVVRAEQHPDPPTGGLPGKPFDLGNDPI